jgi:hypothetical protein
MVYGFRISMAASGVITIKASTASTTWNKGAWHELYTDSLFNNYAASNRI